MADKTANIDYICVIREKNGKTSFETIDIPASTELIARLEGLSVNDNATVLDMQAQMNLAFDDQHRKPINYVSPFSYACSYIDIAYYPASMSFAEYNEQVSSAFNTRYFYINARGIKIQKNGIAFIIA